MFLIVTNERDITSDYIVLELRRRGLSFYRLNTERFSGARVAFIPSRGEDGWIVETDKAVINLSEVRAAYFRRPGAIREPEFVGAGAARRYCLAEWNASLAAALNSLGDRWLSTPMAILAAENKPRQLSLACILGLNVPETLITNDFGQAQSFISQGASVVKPLRQALLEENGEEHVMFTSRIETKDLIDEGSVFAAPLIFQREIKKCSDIRVTVVGDAVYAAEILSQEDDETKIDWRFGSKPDLLHRPHELPRDICKKCIALVKELGLRFGAIDLVLSQEKDYWFLEINPNGQWAWIENRTGMPLTKAIVDELEKIAA